MRALDTNVLVYAAQARSSHHVTAIKVLKDCAEGGEPWAIPWPCLYEFLRVVTHPLLTTHAISLKQAWKILSSLLDSPSLQLLSETNRHREILKDILQTHDVSGNLIFDARIAALLKEHGIDEIITADQDFYRFSFLKVHNPFLPTKS